MAKAKRIIEGDTVNVSFDGRGTCALSGLVLNVPCSTGECWIIEDSSGHIHYVQQFSSITLLNPVQP